MGSLDQYIGYEPKNFKSKKKPGALKHSRVFFCHIIAT